MIVYWAQCGNPHSRIEGTGVFAAHSIADGDTLLKIDDSRIVDEQHPLGSSEDRRHCDYLQAGKAAEVERLARSIRGIREMIGG